MFNNSPIMMIKLLDCTDIRGTSCFQCPMLMQMPLVGTTNNGVQHVDAFFQRPICASAVNFAYQKSSPFAVMPAATSFSLAWMHDISAVCVKKDEEAALINGKPIH